ncbi:nucleoside triphosphate pyrophosphohydrolase [Permianibacter sp. IMCC34836]|uniref:nucleoside triphosphate pyrophosphohydrolase n=1 Tax=Permianibacter fluminis TaxID=2738515 RepID=UPI0015542FFA|nr:nucleoside triphosphate pyrophosphohydrolase [Permianibacter fluminis]NQD37069.1 nucleoside triphosphate pyrophosphohydrolase [Permianibacter fluminis]
MTEESKTKTAEAALSQLLQLMATLRDPDKGCPWDREQTFATIAPYTLEEAYEVADAIAREDFTELKGELGDLLFQVVFYCQMASEQGRFGFADVAQAMSDKLLRRHPHVFADGQYVSHAELHRQWEQRKAEERASKQTGSGTEPSLLDDVPLALPALARSQKIQKRAASAGFDWPDADAVVSKLHEELDELAAARAAGDADAMEDEFGDLLFTCVNLSRHLQLNSEAALRRATDKFSRRFRLVEQLARQQGEAVADLGPDRLEQLWQQAKLQVDLQGSPQTKLSTKP